MDNLKYFISASLMFIASSLVSAGELLITNNSNDPFVCKVSGVSVAIEPNSDFTIAANPGKTINTVRCNDLVVQSLGVNDASSNAFITLNGRQTRSLNVALYPYLPTMPETDFSVMMYQLINEFQQENPDILLNLRLDQNIEVYDNEALANYLGTGGFDVMELDFLYLGYLAQNKLITPLYGYDTSNTLPSALEIAMVDGTLWGMPTWLCTDFLFSYSSAIHNINTSRELRGFLKGYPPTQVHYAGKLQGTWEIPSFYISSYWQTYPERTIAQAIQMPPDPIVVDNMYQLTPPCDFNGTDNCINGVYEGDMAAREFAAKKASSTSGFGETSFYIELFQDHDLPLYAQPIPWGNQIRPLLYADAFAASSANCAADPCASDSRKFINFMSTDTVKNMFAFSEDLASSAPYRRMLASTKSFYGQTKVKADPIYQQISPVVTEGNPYPTYISGPIQMDIYHQVCAALKQKDSRYICNLTQDDLLKSHRGALRRYQRTSGKK